MQLLQKVLFELLAMGGTVKDLIEKKDLVQIVDPVEIEKMVEKVIAENPKQVEQYQGGKTNYKVFSPARCLKYNHYFCKQATKRRYSSESERSYCKQTSRKTSKSNLVRKMELWEREQERTDNISFFPLRQL
ncbi:hypothetical protein VNO80_18667 [Phaseolus coccineus]|uniref:Asn/Gln amidotransferase domain-containing protein n=1 Tax=Phaseolus coccineus TaxID=3886 RepID=A0AAN9QZM6_PHACN